MLGKPRVVLDPWLCLQPTGPELVQRLQQVAELWLVRELWHILDNSVYFTHHPSALMDRLPTGEANETERSSRAQSVDTEESTSSWAWLGESLRVWDAIRLSRDLAGLKLFWLGDGLSESLLPDGISTAIHPINEHLVETLDSVFQPDSPLACGQRDALALAAALGGAPILGVLDDRTAVAEPCQWLRFPREATCTVADAYAQWERARWLEILGSCYCFPLLWGGLRLVVSNVHLPDLISSAALNIEGSDETCSATAPEIPPIDGRRLRLYWQTL